MSSFNYLVQRAQILGEANVTSAPFVGVRKALTKEGLPSSSLDALKFIAEVLSRLDIISIEVHDQVVSGQYAAETTEGQGTFKKKAASILKVLKDYESEINSNTEEIQDYIQKQLKNFTNISATNRGRNTKYKERAKDIAKAKTQMAAGEDADDALADLVIKVISHLDDDAIERADIKDGIKPDASRAMRDAQEMSLADKDYVIEIAFNNPDIKATLVKMLTPFIAAGEDSIFTDEGDTNFDIKVSPDSKLVNNPLLLPGADRNVEKFETELRNALTSAAGDEVRVVVHEPTSVSVAAAAAQQAKDQKQKTMRNMINTARYRREDNEEGAEGVKLDDETLEMIDRAEDILSNLEDMGHNELAQNGAEGSGEDVDVEALDTLYNLQDQGWMRGSAAWNLSRDIVAGGRVALNNILNPPVEGNEVMDMDEELTLESVYDTMGFIKAPVMNENGITSSTCSTQQYLTEATEQIIEESEKYTADYLTEQKEADSYTSAPKEKSVSFKERFKPKTQSQLEELRRYGL